MKFATKFLLGLSGTILVGATLMITVGGGQTAKQLEKQLEKQLVARLEDNAYHMLEKLDAYFAERVLEVRALTEAFISATSSPEQTTRDLREFLRWHREYQSAAFFTADRVAVADTAGPGGGAQEGLEGCWAEIAAGKDATVCVQRSSPGESPTLRLAVVVKAGGATRGVVVLRLPQQVLDEQLREIPGLRASTADLHVDLVDREGVYLYSNYQREKVLREISPDWAFLQEKIRGGQAFGSLKYTNPAEETGEEILAYVREPGFRNFAGNAWTLILFVPTKDVFAPVREMRLKIATIVLVNASLLMTILFLIVRSFTRPIKELGRVAREIGRGDLEARVPVVSRDELGQFAETFNQMADNLQESRRELTVFSSELEELVEARTAESLHTNELLHAELSERVKAQEALATRERLLRLSADIGVTLTLSETLPAVLQRCAGHIVRDLDAAFVRIWTLGSKAGVLELQGSAGMYTRLDGQHSRKIVGEQKIGIIAKEQRPILTNAVLGDPAITDQEWARREGMVAFAGHPLVVDGKTVGVMALFSRQTLEPFVITALATVADRLAAFIGRKQAEELLRISERRHRDLFESSIDGICEVNAAGVFTSMNPAGAWIFGYGSPEEIVGRPLLDQWRDPLNHEKFLEELKAQKALSTYPMPGRKKNGESLEIEVSARIVEDESGGFLGIQGVLRDVTERTKGEAEKDLLLAQLQEAAANIKTLSGLLPICAGCKKIRDDKGSWSQIETYISSHSEAEFSHGLCPDCRKTYFPGFG